MKLRLSCLNLAMNCYINLLTNHTHIRIMDFHQSASERFAEQVFKYIIREFDGKTINSDDCNLDLMIKNLPSGFDDFDLEECLPQVV